MRENYELMKNEIEELKELCSANLSLSHVMEMSADDLKAAQCAVRLVGHAMKFTEAQVATMERLEEKLDKLLAKE